MKSNRLFTVVHQTRFEPAYQFAKQALDRGELGLILRCSMVETDWRTQAYYQDNPWRGTLRGKGGGVLLNQAPLWALFLE
jgi:predicted dehydrogenase